MRLVCAMFAIPGILSLAPIAARADDQTDIKALYNKMAAAFKAKNIQGIMAMGTADFKEKEANGQVFDAKQSEAMMKQQFGMLKSMESVTMTPNKISVKGNKAVVMASFSMKGTLLMNGKPHKMSVTGTGRDTLVKGKGGWKFQMVEELTTKQLLDGKPMPAMGGAPPPKKK